MAIPKFPNPEYYGFYSVQCGGCHRKLYYPKQSPGNARYFGTVHEFSWLSMGTPAPRHDSTEDYESYRGVADSFRGSWSDDANRAREAIRRLSEFGPQEQDYSHEHTHDRDEGYGRRATTASREPRYKQEHPRRGHRSMPPAQRSTTAAGHHSRHTASSRSTPRSPPRAAEADAKRYHTPKGFLLRNWDPTEERFFLLDSVFDANSLGKWIYDWTTYHHGPATPISDMAGELWLLLIQLAGKVKRAEECMPRIR
jgi:hypothetical protein